MSDDTTTHSFGEQEWDIGFDEDTGKIIINSSEKAKSPAPATSGIVEQEMLDQGGGQTGGGQPSNLEARIAQLEGATRQVISFLMGAAQNGGPQIPKPAEAEQKTYDFNEPNSLAQFVHDTVETKINKAIAPLLQVLPQITTRLEFQDTLVKHGKDFQDMLPAIQVLMGSDANLTFEKAFEIVKAVRGVKGQSANQHSTTQPTSTRQQGSAEALIAKANALKTESGVNGTLRSAKPQIGSVRDAFEAAIAELTGG